LAFDKSAALPDFAKVAGGEAATLRTALETLGKSIYGSFFHDTRSNFNTAARMSFIFSHKTVTYL